MHMGVNSIDAKLPGQRGVVLILVLWMLVLLTVIAGALTATQKTEVALTLNQIDQIKGRALAEAGINYGVSRLLSTDPNLYWKPDGQLHQWAFQGSKIAISISDERGRVDLNNAGRELLGGLFEAVGVIEQEKDAMIGAILDWRDTDNNHQLNGAEDPDYRAAGIEYGAKDARFSSVDELRLVLGMTPELYRKLEPALTVHSGMRTADAGLATPLVRSALGLDNVALDDPAEGRGGDTFTTDPAAVAAVPGQRRGSAYRLHAVVSMEQNGQYSSEAIIELDRTHRNGYKVLAWRLNRRVSPEITEQ